MWQKKSSWSKAPIAPIYQYTNGRLIKPWLKGYPINNSEDVAYSRTYAYCNTDVMELALPFVDNASDV
ncbi:hypothetical protein N5V81_27355 [Escherichia coli]|nr:hypothetical protein [Escherichia coli]